MGNPANNFDFFFSQKIESVDRRTLERKAPIKVPLGGSGNKLYSMAAVPDKCPVISTICQYPDICPKGHLCLPKERGSHACHCIENCKNNAHDNNNLLH